MGECKCMCGQQRLQALDLMADSLKHISDRLAALEARPPYIHPYPLQPMAPLPWTTIEHNFTGGSDASV